MAWLYKQKGSENWWLGYRVHGRQVLRSTGTADRKEAERELAKIETLATAHRAQSLTEEFYLALTAAAPNTRTLKAAVESWLKEANGSTAPNTYKNYEHALSKFLEFVNATDSKPLLRDITTENARDFLSTVRQNKLASTANIYRRVLCTFFLSQVKSGSLKSTPLLAVKAFKAGRDEERRRRPFTIAEVQLMFQKADAFWRYMIVAGFYSGQRMGDLACIQYGNIDFAENTIRLTAAKTGKRITIPMANALSNMLLELKNKAGRVKASDYLWPTQAEEYKQRGPSNLSRWFAEQVLVPAGLIPQRIRGVKQGRSARRERSEVSFHCLRHSFVSYLKLSGASQSTAKALAGHSSDQISDLYTHVGEDVMRQAINQLPEVAS